MGTPPPSPGFGKYKLAEHRYGREEMLALFNSETEPPEELKKLTPVYVENKQDPLALVPLSEEEQVKKKSTQHKWIFTLDHNIHYSLESVIWVFSDVSLKLSWQEFCCKFLWVLKYWHKFIDTFSWIWNFYLQNIFPFLWFELNERKYFVLTEDIVPVCKQCSSIKNVWAGRTPGDTRGQGWRTRQGEGQR